MIKTILFDNNGVLCTSNEETGFPTISKMIGLPIPKIRPYYSELASLADEGKISANNQFEKFIEKFASNTDPYVLRDAVYGSFVVKEEVLNFAKELKKEYEIAILTNFSDGYWDLNNRWQLDKVFDKDKFFVSCELGMRKPNSEIYEYVLKKLGRKASEVVFVDDGLKNVEAARGVGMVGIHFKSPKQFKNELKSILETEQEIG